MALEDVASAKRLVLGAVLLYVLWLLANNLFWFGETLRRQHQEQQALERNAQQQRALLLQNIESIKSHSGQSWMAAGHLGRQKLSASALVTRLRQVNAFGLVASPARRLHCSENRGDWDYTCLFHPDPITNDRWVQFAVLVDDAHVIEMSKVYPAGAPLPQPLSPGK